MAYFLDDDGAAPASHAPRVTSRTFFGAAHEAIAHAPHSHDEDQLYWFPGGAMHVFVGTRRWLVRSSAAFWFPAGIVHSSEALNPGATHSIYSSATLRPAGEQWARPRAIDCAPLMAEVIRHMSSATPTPATRHACYELLTHLMQSSHEQQASVETPTHPAARAIAERILADPRDETSLADFARSAGVSARTIMRAFLAETGYGFTQWRTQARLISSLSLLASGMPISGIAESVGYRTSSGYIDAFRKAYGTTPAAYARARGR